MLGSDFSLESCLPLGVRGLDDAEEEEEVVGDSSLDKDDRDEVDDGGVYVV